MQERIRRQDLEALNRNKKALNFSEGDLVLLLDMSTPAAGDRPKKERPVYLKAPYVIRKRLTNLVVLENVLDRKIRHASINHLKHLVSRGRIFQDLPAQYRAVFGHPFRPWELLQGQIPDDVTQDFTTARPQPQRQHTRLQDPEDDQGPPAQDQIGSASPADTEDEHEDTDSDDDDEPNGGQTNQGNTVDLLNMPAIQSTSGATSIPGPSVSPSPTMCDRLRSSRKRLNNVTRRLFRRPK